MFYARSSIARNIISKASPVHPVFAAKHGLNKMQHASIVEQMNKESMRMNIRQFSRLTKNTNLFQKPNYTNLFKENPSSLFKKDSPLMRQILNQQQNRSESTLSFPRPQTENGKAMYVAGAILFLGAVYFILDKTLNQAGVETREYISPEVRRYLTGVYSYLTGGLAISAATAVACWRSGFVMRMAMQHPIAYLLGSTLLCIGALIACRSVDPRNIALKNALFVTYTVLEGVTLSSLGVLGGPVLMKAGVYTLGIFFAMTLIAMTAKHERFLYLGGALYSGLSVLIISSFASIGLSFFGKMPRTVAFLDAALLWGGLALFVAFLLYHTQSIIAHGKQHAALEHSGRHTSTLSLRGPRDAPVPNYIDEALRLYLDIINIFIRLAIIFSNQNNRKK